jgi:hypothetical protein
MDKDAIADLLEETYSVLINWLDSQDEEFWLQGPAGKWTTGQQALHILQSIIPLNNALSLPRFIIKYRFGITNRPLRDYDQIVNRYHERLKEAQGKTYKPSQHMKIPSVADKHYILNRLQTESKKLQYKTRRISDKNLDTLVLPHPLMGKMPIREILMWSAYHVEHHFNTLKSNYSASDLS